MFLFKYSPFSSSVRHQFNLTKNLLSKSNNICKILNFNIKRHAGRSTIFGSITIRHKGNGCKRKFRKLTLNNLKTKSILLFICYDPFRNNFLSLNFDFVNKYFYYSHFINTTYPGAICYSNVNFLDLFFGCHSILSNFPIGIPISCVSSPNKYKLGSKFSRSAGTFCQIVQKEVNHSKLRLPSGKFVILKNKCVAVFGKLGNLRYNLVKLGKAGRNRHLGNRPTVRGIAMNPVDHPHGGRTNGGCHPVSPWGLLAKGKRTSN